MNTQDQIFMKEALAEAKKAFEMDETPIGCVIVRDGQIIGRGFNRRNTQGSVLAHAEIEAIRQACEVVGDWRLDECTMYVTLDPCPMCAGAIVQARMPRTVVGAMNPKAGCAGSILQILKEPRFNHQTELETGVGEEESRELLQTFFKGLRARDKKRKEEVNLSDDQNG